MSNYATVDPTTGECTFTVATMSNEDVSQSIGRAQRAYADWSAVPVAERASVLARIADMFRDGAGDLAALTTAEVGKPIAQAKIEVELTASIFDYYAQEGPEYLRDEVLPIRGAGRSVVQTAPLGPLLGVMPWNFPYYQVARFAAPNLLLGNTILLKHAESCPQEALRIAEIIDAAGSSVSDIYQNLFATHSQIAAILGDPAVRGVSVTGSERAGRAVAELAGRHLKKAVLELGGSDPLIVLPGADIDAAVRAAVANRFANAGQACTATKRIIVMSSVWEEFLPRFLSRVEAWRGGDPRDAKTRLGPMASVQARSVIHDQVQDAVTKGAVLHVGGVLPTGPGAFYPATVLSRVTSEMRAYHEELFGPVAVLYQVGSLDEAVHAANDSAYGLGAAVFTSDEDAARAVIDRLDVGMAGVNMTVQSTPDTPFGGVKNSGIGRELGRFGLTEFCNKKLVRIA